MLIAAIDIGTSSTRALLFDDAAFTGVAEAVEYPLSASEPGAAELDPLEVFEAMLRCLAHVSAAAPVGIDCVVLSAAMHSLLAVDDAGLALTPAHTWADNRPFAEAAALRAAPQGGAVYARTGVPIHPMSPLAKLLWMRTRQPVVFARAARFVSLKEFICHRLFGRWVVDDGIASASGLYDLARRDWSELALGIAGIERARLSAVARPGTLLRGLSPAHAEATGLASDTPFVLGGSDGCLANLGAGLLAGEERRRAVLTIGTSGALRMAVDRPAPDAAMRTFCYALGPEQFVIGGATNGGGLPLRWLRDNFPQLHLDLTGAAGSTGEPYDALAALAAQAGAGAGGLLFHPYLAGERAPLWNADARASFIGLNFSHGPAHLVRAVMEGVLFNLATVLGVLEELAGGPVDEIVAGGGFAHSAFWVQMAADLFGRPLVLSANPETTAQGAALLALQAMGRTPTLASAITLLPQPDRRIGPDPAVHAVYARLAPVFATIPDKLGDVYRRLATLQRAPSSHA
jgi:gluconokinase